MKIKMGDKIYSSDEEPIMVILDPGEKELIAHMAKDDNKICFFPLTISEEDVEKFMEE